MNQPPPPPKGLRTTLIFLAVTLLTLGIGFFTVIAFINSTWFVQLAESRLTELIGQQVRIDSIDVDPGPITKVRLENLSVANPAWASTPFLASVEKLRVGIDILQLFSGNPVLTDVTAKTPIIHLERSPQGRSNWNDGPDRSSGFQAQNPGGPDQDETTFKLPRIESLLVDNGRLTFLDPISHTSLDFLMTAHPVDTAEKKTRMMAKGNGTFFGKPLTVELTTGSLSKSSPEKPESFPLNIQINYMETTLAVRGEVDAALSPETASLQVGIDGKHLSRWNDAFDWALPAIPAYQVAGLVGLSDGIWSIQHLRAAIGHSDVAGNLRVSMDSDTPHVEGDLFSKRLDFSQLQGKNSEPQDSDPPSRTIASILQFLAQTRWRASVSYHADLIEKGNTSIYDSQLAFTLEDQSLDIETLSGTVHGTRLQANGRISTKQGSANSRLEFRLDGNQSARTNSDSGKSRSETAATFIFPGLLKGEVGVTAQTDSPSDHVEAAVTSDHGSPESRFTLTSLILQQFHLHYEDPASHTRIKARLDDQAGENVTIQADGMYRNQPLKFSLALPALNSLFMIRRSSDSFEPITLQVKLKDTVVAISGKARPVWPLTQVNLRFRAHSEAPAATAALFGLTLPQLGPLNLTAQLSRQADTWRLSHMSGQTRQGTIHGEAILETAEALRMIAAFHSDRLDVSGFISKQETGTNASESAPQHGRFQQTGTSETMMEAIPTPPWLTAMIGSIALDVNQLVLRDTHVENISLKATMDNGLLRIKPLSFKLGRGAIMTTAHLDLTESAPSGHLQTEISHVNLNEALNKSGQEAHGLGTVSGRLALRLPAEGSGTGIPANADVWLDRLRIEEVRLRYDDPARQAKTDLRFKADSMTSGLQIDGTIEYRERPVAMTLVTGSLRQALDDYRAMPIQAKFQVQETTLKVKGQVDSLLPLENLTTTVKAEGPDPARLGKALGIPLPHLPPYRLRAQVHRKQEPSGIQTLLFNNLDGTIGDSDIAGLLRVMTGNARPWVYARLQSRKLDFDDLAGLIGAPPDPQETVSAKQQLQAETFKKRDRVLPDKSIKFSQLQQIDADVEYRALRVQAPKLPLDDFTLHLTIDDGRLEMDRLDFGVAQGTVGITFEIDAHDSPVRVKLMTSAHHVNLSELLAPYDVADDSFGTIGGQGTLWMKGESLAQWLASSDGGLFLTMTGGRLDALLVELAGLDFAESAVAFLGTDTGVPIDCGYTDLQARSGVVTIRPFLIDSKDTKFQGQGRVDLRQESLKLTIHPYPKDFTILSSRGPLHVAGRFADPGFSVDPSFPFPDFGTADDHARCNGMVTALREARQGLVDTRQRQVEKTE